MNISVGKNEVARGKLLRGYLENEFRKGSVEGTQKMRLKWASVTRGGQNVKISEGNQVLGGERLRGHAQNELRVGLSIICRVYSS